MQFNFDDLILCNNKFYIISENSKYEVSKNETNEINSESSKGKDAKNKGIQRRMKKFFYNIIFFVFI